MMILITGTPGTGKTTAAKLLAERLQRNIVFLNDLVTGEVMVGFDEEADSKIADMDKLTRAVKEYPENSIVEGHLAHLLDVEGMVMVLRTRPDVLEKRLLGKGFKDAKVRENLEAEALDVCLVEAMEGFDDVYEVDTTAMSPEVVAEAMEDITNGQGGKYLPGKIDWSGNFFL